MENAVRRIPCVLRLLEDRLSKERKDLAEWNRHLTSNDKFIIRQANSNIASNQSRIEQLELALADLVPPVKKEENEV
jgi:hypothetical protein